MRHLRAWALVLASCALLTHPLQAVTTPEQADSLRGGNQAGLGHTLLAAGDLEGAEKTFRELMDRGQVAAGHNGMGLVHLRRGDARRARSSFRRAIRSDPDFVDAHYNLGIAYEGHRRSDARKAFRAALDLDHGYRDAHFRLGRLLEEGRDTTEAISAYRSQITADPGHSGARFRLAKLLLARGDADPASGLFEAVRDAGGETAPKAHLELALIRQKERDFARAQASFEAYIGSLPEKERLLYRDISLVTNKEELAYYEAASDDEKEDLIRRFWTQLDPAPLSTANERLIEHYRRVAHARKHFGVGEFPWDSRGEVFVRLGEPDHVSRSNDIRAELDRDIQDARTNFMSRFRIGLRVDPGLPIFPVASNDRWEYWVYTDIDDGLEITFVARYGKKRYEYAPMPQNVSMRLTQELLRLQGRVLIDQMVSREPSVYEPDFADLPIDFYYYPADYRGGDGRTRLEIYYGLPASEVSRLRVDEETDLLVLGRGMVLFDSLWNEAHRVQDQIAFTVPTDQQIQEGAFIPGVLPVDLEPGPYRLAFQIRDLASGKSQVYRRDIEVEGYAQTQRLQISDIELAFSVAEAQEDGPFVKEGLEVIPMSSRAFRRDHHAFVYFEIYNLTRDEYGQTQYRVEYKIRTYKKRSVPARVLHGLGRLLRVSEKDQEVEIAYDQTGAEANEVTYVELDLKETEPGRQRVTVTVHDLLAERSTTKDITFIIVPQ
ncbi:MAG: tetratricopeptide repeat protein [Candidatus Latescibacteria bacterium]|jgi:GWxTD domain-containing protein|nr:tetratricopeptide repeat protein [Candidatus Latescibacterota bacterium]